MCTTVVSVSAQRLCQLVDQKPCTSDGCSRLSLAFVAQGDCFGHEEHRLAKPTPEPAAADTLLLLVLDHLNNLARPFYHA